MMRFREVYKQVQYKNLKLINLFMIYMILHFLLTSSLSETAVSYSWICSIIYSVSQLNTAEMRATTPMAFGFLLLKKLVLLRICKYCCDSLFIDHFIIVLCA